MNRINEMLRGKCVCNVERGDAFLEIHFDGGDVVRVLPTVEIVGVDEDSLDVDVNEGLRVVITRSVVEDV